MSTTSLRAPKETRFQFQRAFIDAYMTDQPERANQALGALGEDEKDFAQDPILLYSGRERAVPVNLRHLSAIAGEGNPAWSNIEQDLSVRFGLEATPPDMPGDLEISQFNSWPVDLATFAAVERAKEKRLSPSQTAASIASTRARAVSAAVFGGSPGMRHSS
jgi:hypothetical protein